MIDDREIVSIEVADKLLKYGRVTDSVILVIQSYLNERLTKFHFFLGILDDPEKPPIKSTTPKKSQLEPYNNPIDIPQIFKQNMIFISGLPSNMPNESLFGRLDTVFSAVGEIKVITRTYSTKHMLDSIISYLD
jgi:hypothetical protein